MQEQEIQRFSLGSRWLHWMIVLSSLALLVTGIVLYVPQWGIVAEDGWTRLFHRIIGVVFVAIPLLYLLLTPRSALSWVKKVFTWGKDDFEWLKAAPDYYFGGDKSKMPPQPEMNSGQKLWALVAILCAIGLAITGLIMWFFKGDVSPGVFQACIFLHDLFVIVGGSFTLLHFYLGAIHPRMTESLRSMIGGKVSVEYAKSHHAKWYEEVTRAEEVVEETLGEGEE